MKGMLAAEIRKMRRSVVPWTVLAVIAVPLALTFVGAARKGLGTLDWAASLSITPDAWALGSFVILVIAANHIFTREHQDDTIQWLHATPHPTRLFLLCKLIAGLLVLAVTTLASLAVRLGAALVLASGPLSGEVTAGFVRAVMLTALEYGMLLPWVSLIGILARRTFLGVVVSLAVVVLLFPFHRADVYYLFPPVIPVVHFSRALGFASDRVFTPEGWLSLGVFLSITLPLCFVFYRRE
jgi:ABC-type transport system involved in multi-copper enzyme maturation permease subunit